MVGSITGKTSNYGFSLIRFDAPRYQDIEHQNWQTLDALLFAVTAFTGPISVWLNSTAYVVGDRVVDTVGGGLYQCAVNHTSRASGNLQDDIAAHPTYWTPLGVQVNNRGAWVTAVTYHTNDFVADAHRYGVVLNNYTSGASYNADVAAGHILTLIDLSADLAAADASAAAAAASAALAASLLSTKVSIDGSIAMTGQLTLFANPVNPLHAAAKQYVDTFLSKGGGTMTGAIVLAADPVSALQAATKQYVDNLVQGLDAKPSVVCATTANISLTGEQTIDGILTSGSRILVKNQTSAFSNGIYVTGAGAWTRALDMDNWLEVPNAYVWVEGGTINADTGWVCTSGPGGTIGSTNMTWVQFSSASGSVSKGGDTMVGDLTIAKASASVILDKLASGNSGPRITGATNNLSRWSMLFGNAIAESGGNAGSDLTLLRFDDAGTLIDTPLTWTRSTGVAAFLYRPTFASNLAWDAGNMLAQGRNFVINGAMEVAQRGTSFATPANLAYTLDRWSVTYDGTIGTFTINQGTHGNGAPSTGERKNFIQWSHTAAGSGSTFRQLIQRIPRLKTLSGKQVTLSFYANADAARSVTAAWVRIYGTGGSPSATDSVNFGTAALTTTAQRFSYTLTLPDLTGKTLGSNNDDFAQLTFVLPLNTNMTINIWDVQLELGPSATEFERKSFERELNDCLPFYEKSFDYAIAPAQNTSTVNVTSVTQAVAASITQTMPNIRYRQKKIKAPTVTLYNPAAANAQARNMTTAADCSATAVNAGISGQEGFGINTTTAGGSAVGNIIGYHWTAEAEF